VFFSKIVNAMVLNSRFETDCEKLRRPNRELSILNTIAEALIRSVALDQKLGSALAQLAELLNLQTGWIWLLEEKVGESQAEYQSSQPSILEIICSFVQVTTDLWREAP